MAQPANSDLIILFTILVLLIAPVSAAGNNTAESLSPPYSITLFIPTASMIHSTQIMDMVNVPDAPGSVLLATSFGLSQYNGTWSTRHINLNNVSEGLLSDYITALEYDRDGSLWIGYSGGIQIYNGHYYLTIRDQQLFKDPRITAIRRWNDDMWVLTGNSGIHRYHEGEWTWYQPESRTGPGFYEANGLILDSAANTLIIATDHEGLWRVPSQSDPIRFECIASHDSTYGLLSQVRRDPMGGVLFFNNTMVAHYAQDSPVITLLTSDMLSPAKPDINDVAAGPDGRLYLATDKGIYIWKNGKIIDNLDRYKGIGTFPIVQWVSVDAEDRIWFSTNDDVGVITDTANPLTLLAIDTITPAVSSVNGTAWPYPGTIPTLREDIILTNATQSGLGNPLSVVIDPLLQAIHSLLAGAGFR